MPNRPVAFTPAAKEDLDNIWLEIAFDNVAAADRTIDQIEKRTAQLLAFPESGRLRSEIADDMRSLTSGNYIVLYKVEENSVTVVRVIHGARDLTALF
jgi:toxin ParE1/3/4